VEFDADAVRILDPCLPGAVGTEFLPGMGNAQLIQMSEHGRHVGDLESNMIDRSLPSRISFEHFDKGILSRPQIIPERGTLLFKREVAGKSEGRAVERFSGF